MIKLPTAVTDQSHVLSLRMRGDENRVILLPFLHGSHDQIRAIIEFVRDLEDATVNTTWEGVRSHFAARHRDFENILLDHAHRATRLVSIELPDRPRELLAGAYFSMEYAFQAAALFNPSIVPHPDQTGMPAGVLRFVMSLRAVGEGHLSSVIFRTGTVDAQGHLELDPTGHCATPTRIRPDHHYLRALFRRKLSEMKVPLNDADVILSQLPDRFTYKQLDAAVTSEPLDDPASPGLHSAVHAMLWLAESNYSLRLPEDAAINELLIFPRSSNEARGIEDMRLVPFVDDDGQVTYYGTYTAFDGSRTLPMLMETTDFRHLSFHTLNGACVQNKGMALFPRRIDGHYAMCSRVDGRRHFLMMSDHLHFWESATLLTEPKYPWEYRIMGNCGSPLETDEGWLLITHGVGPMRQYSIGAMLLDLDDPFHVIGRCVEPIVVSPEEERGGYVPNVVYSCGSLLWNNQVILPFAYADHRVAVAVIPLPSMLDTLKSQ